MEKEHQQQKPLEALSIEELISQARGLVEEIENLGYPGLRLAFLITGSRYRLDSLFYAAKRANEEERFKQLTREESDQLWKSIAETYDGLSVENLTETFRYQYDREQREKKLNGPKYPGLDSPEYQSFLEIFQRISLLLKELKRRYPDQSPHDYLPTRLNGQWID